MLLTVASRAVAGVPDPILVSGQTNNIIIDANNNGIIGDSGDCILSSTLLGGAWMSQATQGSSPNPLRMCTGPCYGSLFFSVEEAFWTINSCNWTRPPGGPFVPAGIVMSSSPSTPSPSPTIFAQGNAVTPVVARFGQLTYPFFEPAIDAGSAFVCNDNGPAVQVKTIHGLTVVQSFKFVTSGNIRYACLTLPFERQDLVHENVLLDSCTPVREDGTIDLALQSAPDVPLQVTDLNALSSCGGGLAAPTIGQLGLVLLLLGLLGVGTMTLSRRRGFAEGLPLP